MVVKGADDFISGKGGKEGVQIRALDDYTFQCDLIGPMPYAVDMMAHYSFAILPMHVINAKGDDWIKVENIVGNGPFKLAEWKPQESLTLSTPASMGLWANRYGSIPQAQLPLP